MAIKQLLMVDATCYKLMVDCCWTGKTELAKQVANYLHKDKKKVSVKFIVKE